MARPVLDEYIREAHNELYNMTEWMAAMKRTTVTLIDDQTAYDFPDDCWPADIVAMTVKNTTGQEFEVHPGMRPNERNAAATASGRPLRYEIMDRTMNVYPAADTDSYTTLQLDYKTAEPAFVEDKETIVVDSRALIALAAIKVREHFGMPVTKRMTDSCERIIQQAVAEQSDGETFHFGGHKSAKLTDIQSNRIQEGSNSQASGDDWNPPGLW